MHRANANFHLSFLKNCSTKTTVSYAPTWKNGELSGSPIPIWKPSILRTEHNHSHPEPTIDVSNFIFKAVTLWREADRGETREVHPFFFNIKKTNYFRDGSGHWLQKDVCLQTWGLLRGLYCVTVNAVHLGKGYKNKAFWTKPKLVGRGGGGFIIPCLRPYKTAVFFAENWHFVHKM